MAKSLKQKNQPQLVTFVLLNVMGLGAIDLFRFVPVVAHDLAGGARGFDGAG